MDREGLANENAWRVLRTIEVFTFVASFFFLAEGAEDLLPNKAHVLYHGGP